MDENFSKFQKRVIIFDSLASPCKEMESKIEGKRDLAIFIEAKKTNNIFGGYFSIPFPIPKGENTKYIRYKDPNSCIFEVRTNQICEASPKVFFSFGHLSYFLF